MERFSRRTFMKLAVVAVGVLAFAPFRRVFGQNNVEWVSVGPADNFPVGEPVLTKEGVRTPVIVYRQENGISVLSPKCTHKGCTVTVKKNGIYACPCHGAQYDYDGTVTKGPANRDLETYMVKISDTGEVLVGI